MIDKYKLLNNEKINFDKYSELETDNEIIKNIVKSKIKKSYTYKRKKMIASVGLLTLVGLVTLSDRNTWGYVENFVSHIETFFNKEYDEFDKYKFEGNKSITKNGLKFNLGDVIIDDKRLILSISLDYSDFDFEKYKITKKDLIEGLTPSTPEVTIGDIDFGEVGGSMTPRYIKREDKVEFLIIADLYSIDTDSDGIHDTDIEILDELEKGKDYNMKIKFKDFFVDNVSNYVEVNSMLNNIGEFEFNTTINVSNILNDLKVVEVNKVFDINENGMEYKLKIDEIRITPLSVNVTTEIIADNMNDYDLDIAKYNTPVYVLDENGEMLLGGGGGLVSSRYYHYFFELKGDIKKATVVAVVTVQREDDEKHFDTKELFRVEVDIP